MPSIGGDRPLWRAIEWRPWEEWKATEAALSSRDRFNSLGWRHASRAPEGTFERALVLVYGGALRTALQTLQGREAWRSTALFVAPQWQRLCGVRVQDPPEGAPERPPKPGIDVWCLPYYELMYPADFYIISGFEGRRLLE